MAYERLSEKEIELIKQIIDQQKERIAIGKLFPWLGSAWPTDRLTKRSRI
jgi:hypothetical protein